MLVYQSMKWVFPCGCGTDQGPHRSHREVVYEVKHSGRFLPVPMWHLPLCESGAMKYLWGNKWSSVAITAVVMDVHTSFYENAELKCVCVHRSPMMPWSCVIPDMSSSAAVCLLLADISCDWSTPCVHLLPGRSSVGFFTPKHVFCYDTTSCVYDKQSAQLRCVCVRCVCGVCLTAASQHKTLIDPLTPLLKPHSSKVISVSYPSAFNRIHQ